MRVIAMTTGIYLYALHLLAQTPASESKAGTMGKVTIETNQSKASAIYSFTLDNKKLEPQAGIPASSTGILKIQIKGIENLEKKHSDKPLDVELALIRGSRLVPNYVLRYSISKANTGIPMSDFSKAAQPGDRILIELKNSKQDYFANIPLM